MFGRFATNPDLTFTWYAAATLSSVVRMQAVGAFHSHRFRRRFGMDTPTADLCPPSRVAELAVVTLSQCRTMTLNQPAVCVLKCKGGRSTMSARCGECNAMARSSCVPSGPSRERPSLSALRAAVPNLHSSSRTSVIPCPSRPSRMLLAQRAAASDHARQQRLLAWTEPMSNPALSYRWRGVASSAGTCSRAFSVVPGAEPFPILRCRSVGRMTNGILTFTPRPWGQAGYRGFHSCH